MSSLKRVLSLFAVLVLLLNAPVYAITNRQEKWFNLMEDEYIGLGRGIDQDDVEGEQCVDVASNYAAFIFPINNHKYDYKQTLNWGNAKDLYANAYSEYFEKIPFMSGFVANRGDIAVWGGPTTLWGHVGVVSDAYGTTLEVIDQYGSTQDGIWKRTVSVYSGYSGVLIGFLRPREDVIKRLNPGKDGEQYYEGSLAILSRGSELERLEVVEERERSLNSDGYNACVSLGLIRPGNGNRPSDLLTRLEGSILVLRILGLEENSKNMSQDEIKSIYENVEDSSDVPNWAKSSLAYAVDMGIIKGTSTTDKGKLVLSPNGNITGEQYTTMLLRAIAYKDIGLKNSKLSFESYVENGEEVSKFISDKSISRDEAGALTFAMVKGANLPDTEGSKKMLHDLLIERGVISEESYNNVK